MRNRLSAPLVCALVSLVACGGTEPTAYPPVPPTPQIPPYAGSPTPASPVAAAGDAKTADAPKKLDADSPLTTPSGSTFTAAKGWTVTTRKDVLVLEDPNHEVSVSFLEGKEREGADAIAAAWKRVQPDFARKVRLATKPPARDGWDAVANIDYETTTAESRSVWATARRKGDTWYIALFDGGKAAWGRRWPQANLAYSSFKAKGVVEESFLGKKAHVLDEARLQVLDAFAEEVRGTMKIPGAAIAVVQNGKVVFEKGYGIRELGKKDAVTPKTLFMIASMTKPLTTLLMATAIDEGKFTWETPVTQIYPTFALGDPEATKKLTMKHTACACTGLPRHDAESFFEYATTTPEKMIEGMKIMKPTTGFGETFQYSNPLVAAGGYIAAHALDPKKPLNQAYQAAMQAKVFGPVGMKTTTFDVETAKRAGNASPHGWTMTIESVGIPLSDEGFVNSWLPTGGAWSNVQDLSRYLLLELAKGKTPEGKQVVSESGLLKRREPQAKSSDKSSYGLGLGIGDDHGVQVFEHGGAVMGFSSIMFFLPEHGVGAVVLANLGQSHAFHGAVRRKLFEVLFDGRDEARENFAFFLKTREEGIGKQRSRIDFNPDRAWLDKFVGTYSNPSLGTVTVRVDGKQGIFDAGEFKSAIGRKKEEDGTLKLVLTNATWKWMEFLPEEANGKTTLTFEVGQQKYVFEPVKTVK
jgi:CubicO group peptidase (beta-lactamase class C family)